MKITGAVAALALLAAAQPWQAAAEIPGPVEAKRAAPAAPLRFKTVIPVANTFSCPPPCQGVCVFQDTFVIGVDKSGDPALATGVEDYFSRGVVGGEGKADRNFKKLVSLRFTDEQGVEHVCRSPRPEDLKDCGLEIMEGESPEVPAGFRRGGPLKAFQVKYSFEAHCECGEKADPQEVTIDLEFKDGKFFVAGQERK